MDLADLAEVGLARTFAAVLANDDVIFELTLCVSALPAEDLAVELALSLLRTEEALLAIAEPVLLDDM